MIASIREFVNRVLGRGEATITVPSFDGALKPNQALGSAETLLECEAPEDIAVDGNALLIADGPRLLRLPDRRRQRSEPLNWISALAVLPAGRLAVALSGTEVRIYDDISAENSARVFSGELHAVNALAPAPDGTLIATDGSSARGVDDWAWDLMELAKTGRVFRLDPKTGTVMRLARGLGYAFGAVASGGDVLVSESWQHRVISISPDGTSKIVLVACRYILPGLLRPAMEAFGSQHSPPARNWSSSYCESRHTAAE